MRGKPLLQQNHGHTLLWSGQCALDVPSSFDGRPYSFVVFGLHRRVMFDTPAEMRARHLRRDIIRWLYERGALVRPILRWNLALLSLALIDFDTVLTGGGELPRMQQAKT